MTDSNLIDASALLSDTQFLRRLATRLVGASDAEDVAQDVMIAAASDNAPADVDRRWLAGVTHRVVAFRRRGDARRRQRETAAAREERVAPADELVQRAEMQRMLTDAVNALPQPLRDVVVLRFFEDLPPRAIAKRLAIPVNTVRSRTRRAIDELRGRLDASHGDRRTWVAALAPLTLPRAAVVPVLFAVAQPARIAVAALLICAMAVGGFVAFGGGSAAVLPDLASDRAVASLFGDDASTDPAPAERQVVTPVVVDRGGDRIRGRIVDTDDNPVDGATVYYGSRDWLDVARRVEPLQARLRETRSDATGDFELAHPRDVGIAFADGGFELGEPLHDDYVADLEDTPWQFGDEPKLVMRRLLPARIEVEVFDERGDPVPAFYVSAVSFWNVERQVGRWRSYSSVRRDLGRDGVFGADVRVVERLELSVRIECPGVGAGEYGELVSAGLEQKFTVEAADVVRARFDVDLRAAERAAANVSRGKVVDDATGDPVAGAKLMMRTGGWFSKQQTTRINQAGADGRFVIARPKDGATGTLTVSHDDYQSVEVAASGDDLGEIRLTGRGSFACTVVGEDGQPIVGMPFLFRTRERGTHERGTTDDDGRVEFSGLLDGRYYLYLLDDPMDPDEKAVASDSFSVRAGVDLDERFVVDGLDRFPVRGVVLAPFTRPVVPAFVPLTGNGGWILAELRGHGNFDAGGMRPGHYLVALVPADDGDRETPATLLPPIEIDGFSARALELRWPNGSVHGKLELPTGLAASDLRVVASPTLPAGDSPARELVASAVFAKRLGTPVAPDGTFRVAHLADGAHELQLRRGATILARRPVTVAGVTDAGAWVVER